MVFTIGLLMFLVGAIGYKIQQDILQRRKMKNCDVLDAHYCFDCQLYKQCIKLKGGF